MEFYGLKTRLFVTVCLFKEFVCGAEYLTNSSHEESICSTWKYRVFHGVVTTPGFPGFTPNEENGFCRCVAVGNSLRLGFSVLYVIGDKKYPLTIKYWTRDYQKYYWPWIVLNETARDSNMLYVIDNARMLELTLDISGQMPSLFRIVIKDVPEKDSQDMFRMNCTRLSDDVHTTGHDVDDADATTPSNTEKPDQLCLPGNIVILGSVLVGVCLLILIISIAVCCVMTKKRKRMVTKSMNPGLYDDATMKPDIRNAMSGIYSDPIEMRQKGPSVAASNNTYRQTDAVRKPVSVQYSHTMNTQQELYNDQQQQLYSNQNEWT